MPTAAELNESAHTVLHYADYVIKGMWNRQITESLLAEHFPDIKEAAQKVAEGMELVSRLVEQHADRA